MARNPNNYSQDRDSQEDFNVNDKYSVTGESEFSRESTVPYDQDEVLAERHYTFGSLENISRKRSRAREPRSEPITDHRGRGPKGYRRSDETIKEDVSEALYRSSEVDASEIEVKVENGIVTLKGFIDDRNQKRLAEATIENLAGIEDVYNDLRIRNKGDIPKPGKNGLMDNITGMN
jgi:hypothetical protein